MCDNHSFEEVAVARRPIWAEYYAEQVAEEVALLLRLVHHDRHLYEDSAAVWTPFGP